MYAVFVVKSSSVFIERSRMCYPTDKSCDFFADVSLSSLHRAT